MSTIAYIGIGSNVGNRARNIVKALEKVRESPHVKIKVVSSLYETEPVGYKDQSWFLNGAAEIETDLSPRELLGLLKNVESRLKRKSTIRWGPRIIDLDLLIYADLKYQDDALSIPHPRLSERAFVLAPLSEIAPQARIPGGRTVGELFENFPLSDEVGFFSRLKIPHVIVHRTTLPGLAENSLESIREILKLDYPDWVEIDLALSVDGRMVVLHDEVLQRTTTGEGLVATKTHGELKELRIKNPQGEPLDEGIPTLEEVLELFVGARSALQIDIKDLDNHRGEDDLIELLNGSTIKDRVIITSIDFRLLRRLRHLDPIIRLGYNPKDMYHTGLIDHLQARYEGEDLGVWDLGPELIKSIINRIHEIRVEAVYLDHKTFLSNGDSWETLGRLHEGGLEVDAWTVDEERRMKELIELGVDRITTNRADQLKKLIAPGF